MSDNLPALPDAEPEPLEPTTVITAPAPAAPPAPAAAPTILISARTIPEPTAEPKPRQRPAAPKKPRRTAAESIRMRKDRHHRRRAARAAARTDAEQELLDEEELLDDQPDEQPAPRVRRPHTYRRYQHPEQRRRRTLDERQRGRVKTLLVTGTAAGIGWSLGLGRIATGALHTLGAASPSWAVGVGLAAVAAGAYVDFVLRGGRSPRGAIRVRDIHRWSLIFAVIARVPLATCLLALGLYAPGRI